MKKKIIIIVSILIVLILSISIYYFIAKKDQVQVNLEPIVNITYKEDLNVEFLSKVHISDFIVDINGKIINDSLIDTKTLGYKEVSYDYLNDDNIKVHQKFTINIVDTTPVIWLGASYTVNVGSNINLTEKIMCGDNYDNNPKCEVIGKYDLNKVGTYPLTFMATDSSGNITQKDFNLYVKKSSSNPSGSSSSSRILFSDVIKNFKTENTEIGLDLSEWQGNVDFEKLKKAGVEFVILRVGSTHGRKGDYFVDGQFYNNIKKANEVGIPVGIYFYSYADSKEKAIADANWVLDKIKDVLVTVS